MPVLRGPDFASSSNVSLRINIAQQKYNCTSHNSVTNFKTFSTLKVLYRHHFELILTLLVPPLLIALPLPRIQHSFKRIAYVENGMVSIYLSNIAQKHKLYTFGETWQWVSYFMDPTIIIPPANVATICPRLSLPRNSFPFVNFSNPFFFHSAIIRFFFCISRCSRQTTVIFWAFATFTSSSNIQHFSFHFYINEYILTSNRHIKHKNGEQWKIVSAFFVPLPLFHSLLWNLIRTETCM